jgi:hypothetical protein
VRRAKQLQTNGAVALHLCDEMSYTDDSITAKLPRKCQELVIELKKCVFYNFFMATAQLKPCPCGVHCLVCFADAQDIYRNNETILRPERTRKWHKQRTLSIYQVPVSNLTKNADLLKPLLKDQDISNVQSLVAVAKSLQCRSLGEAAASAQLLTQCTELQRQLLAQMKLISCSNVATARAELLKQYIALFQAELGQLTATKPLSSDVVTVAATTDAVEDAGDNADGFGDDGPYDRQDEEDEDGPEEEDNDDAASSTSNDDEYHPDKACFNVEPLAPFQYKPEDINIPQV